MALRKFCLTTKIQLRFPEDGPWMPAEGMLLDEDSPLVIRRLREGLIAPLMPGVESEADPEDDEAGGSGDVAGGDVAGSAGDETPGAVALEDMTRDELLEVAREYEIVVPGNASKKVILEAIEAVMAAPEE